MPPLLNVDKALDAILSSIQPTSSQSVSLPDALHRVLAEDVVSEINLPPFDNSAMDGYAIRAADSMGASPESPASLRVVMDIPAGQAPTTALQAGQAARIMTGAPVPDGADAIIPVEDTDSDFSNALAAPMPDMVQIYRAVARGHSIRQAGETIRIGQIVLSKGTILRPADIGMLAALGKAIVPVLKQPRVAVVGSGDELLDVDEALVPGKIRDVNSYTLEALLRANHAIPIRMPIAPDDPQAIRELFAKTLALQPDMIISSAGVSVGAADYVRQVMEEMGNIDFWRINLRPGKPLAFGTLGGVPFFGLPGNPVSAMVTFEVLVRPALLKLAGREDASIYITAITGEPMRSDGRRTYARVQLRHEDGRYVAYETGTQSSGALISMMLADGLLIIPEDLQEVPAGTALKVKLLRPLPDQT